MLLGKRNDEYDDYDDDLYDPNDQEEIAERRSIRSDYRKAHENSEIEYIDNRIHTKRNNIIEFSNNHVESKTNIVIANPKNINDAIQVANHVKDNKACIVTLEDIDKTDAQRIADFIGGSLYALNGYIERINKEIFIAAPASFNVTGDIADDLASTGFVFKKVAHFG